MLKTIEESGKLECPYKGYNCKVDLCAAWVSMEDGRGFCQALHGKKYKLRLLQEQYESEKIAYLEAKASAKGI